MKQLRMIAQLQAVVTQAIFDHALKVRLTADAATGEARSSIEAASGSNIIATNDVEDSETTAVAQPTEGDNESGSPNNGSEMIGRINNLITTDVSTLEYANEVLLVCT